MVISPSRGAEAPGDAQRPTVLLSRVLRRTWEIFRDHVGTLVIVFLVPMVVFSVVSILAFLALFGTLAVQQDELLDLTLPVATTVGLFLIVLAAVVLYTYAAIAGFFVVATRGKVSTRVAYREATGHFWKYLGVMIMQSLIVTVGFFFLIIPGIIFMAWFIVAPAVVVVERQGVIAAMRRSRELVRGRIWSTLFVILVYGLVYAGVSISLGPLPAGNVFLMLIGPPFSIAFQYALYSELAGRNDRRS